MQNAPHHGLLAETFHGCSEEAVLGNRDLLQRIIRLSLDGGPDATSAVPLHLEHASAWGVRLLVSRFWKVRICTLMVHPPFPGTCSRCRAFRRLTAASVMCPACLPHPLAEHACGPAVTSNGGAWRRM